MLITAHNYFTSTCQRAGKKFIIIRVFTYSFWKCCNRIYNCILNHKFEHWLKVNCWMIFSQDFPYSTVFFQNVRRDNQLDSIISPCLKDLIGRPAEKDPRHKHVCVENNFHFLPRAFDTAFVISTRFSPAAFACRRAC